VLQKRGIEDIVIEGLFARQDEDIEDLKTRVTGLEAV
jgi:hypothetical protein